MRLQGDTELLANAVFELLVKFQQRLQLGGPHRQLVVFPERHHYS